jgi:hypothetical protein
MSDEAAVVTAAKQLLTKDEAALLLEIGLREKAIDVDPAAANDPNLQVVYDSTHMGLLDDIKSLGLRIMSRWNKELYGLVCPAKSPAGNDDAKKLRDKLLGALNLDEAALIAAVVPGLMFLGAPAAIAAAVAPLIVKKFIIPTKDELCDAWGEAMQA